MPNRNNNNIMFVDDQPKSGLVHVSEYVVRKHIVYIDDEIGCASNYREVVSALLNAQETDVVEFVINTNGGDLQAALQIVEAINLSPASIRAMVLGNCYSAGTIIAMNCPEVYISNSAEFMLHHASWGVQGAAHNVKAQNDFVFSQTSKLVTSLYEGFLSEKEIKELLSGKEFWFTAEEARSRMIKRS